MATAVHSSETFEFDTYPEYNSVTGEVWIRDIDPSVQEIGLFWPSHFSAIEDYWDENLTGDHGFYHWDERVVGSYLLNYTKWTKVFGFEKDFFAGTLMVPGADPSFIEEGGEWNYWSSAAILDSTMTAGARQRRKYGFQVVPEPSTLGLCVVLLGLTRPRRSRDRNVV